LIPVKKQPEPTDFEDKVVRKGRIFLNQNPRPNSWKNRTYWTEILPELRNAYRGICAYCCHYIPGEQNATVDHFIPKSIAPHKAYEWDNYRLATSKMNSKKGSFTDVVDPFEITEGAFWLLFPTMMIKPNPDLPKDQKDQVWNTINRLRLNDDRLLVQSRLEWVLDYCDEWITFQYLKEHVPFIAYEIERQNLHDKLPVMFRRRNI
jgi:uncharacterized protein (TIGR02646 family)